MAEIGCRDRQLVIAGERCRGRIDEPVERGIQRCNRTDNRHGGTAIRASGYRDFHCASEGQRASIHRKRYAQYIIGRRGLVDIHIRDSDGVAVGSREDCLLANRRNSCKRRPIDRRVVDRGDVERGAGSHRRGDTVRHRIAEAHRAVVIERRRVAPGAVQIVHQRTAAGRDRQVDRRQRRSVNVRGIGQQLRL